MPNGDAETVQFKSPTTGVVKPLGSEDWEEALSRGYKPVDHTVMFSPEGKRGMVPNAELRDYMGQGYQTTPKTQFEQERPGHGISLEDAGTAACETAKGIPGGLLSQVDPTRGLTGWVGLLRHVWIVRQERLTISKIVLLLGECHQAMEARRVYPVWA
jgi:hypothetical protein